MFKDATLTFNSNFGTGTGFSASGTLGTILDLTGSGSGTLPTRMIGGVVSGVPSSNTALGADIGFGDGMAIPYLVIQATAAGTGSGTAQFFLQSAPDNGSGSPGTYTKVWTGPSIVGSLVTKGYTIQVQVPPAQPGPPPRFYAVGCTISSTASVTVIADLTINPQSSLEGVQYSNNFIAA